MTTDPYCECIEPYHIRGARICGTCHKLIDGIPSKPEMVNHPAHYGGADDPYEAIKVIEAWGLSFHLGSLLKYVKRCGKKNDEIEELEKARWYLDREIANRKRERNAK